VGNRKCLSTRSFASYKEKVWEPDVPGGQQETGGCGVTLNVLAWQNQGRNWEGHRENLGTRDPSQAA
jgi:hypothetical protein